MKTWTLKSEGHKIPAWLCRLHSLLFCTAVISDQMQVYVLLLLLENLLLPPSFPHCSSPAGHASSFSLFCKRPGLTKVTPNPCNWVNIVFLYFFFFPEGGMKYWSKAFRSKQKFKGKPFIRVSQYGCMATESFSALTLKNKLCVMVKSAQLWWLTQTQHLFHVFTICCFLHNSCFTLQCSRLQKEGGWGVGKRVNKTHD